MKTAAPWEDGTAVLSRARWEERAFRGAVTTGRRWRSPLLPPAQGGGRAVCNRCGPDWPERGATILGRKESPRMPLAREEVGRWYQFGPDWPERGATIPGRRKSPRLPSAREEVGRWYQFGPDGPKGVRRSLGGGRDRRVCHWPGREVGRWYQGGPDGPKGVRRSLGGGRDRRVCHWPGREVGRWYQGGPEGPENQGKGF